MKLVTQLTLVAGAVSLLLSTQALAEKLVFLTEAAIDQTRDVLKSGQVTPDMQRSYDRLLEEANNALTAGPFSVTNKGMTPPSGDKHDYLSISPYWWPDESKSDGLPKLKAGQITFCVLAEAATDEPNRLICAGIALAIPKSHIHGYIAEHHGYGMTEKRTEDLCEDLAATMLATTLGVQFDAEKAWDEREQQYMMSGEIVKTRGFVQTAEGDKTGLWTSVISAVVMIL